MFCLRIVLLLFLVSGTLTQDDFGFSLEDALDPDPTPKPSKPDKPAVVPPKSGGDGFGLDLEDALGPDPAPKPKPDKPAVKPGGDGFGLDLEDAMGPDPAPKPKPDKPAVKPGGDGFGLDLEDALGPDPAPKPKPDKPAVKPGGGGGAFDDSALSDAAEEINPGGLPDDPPPYHPNSGHGGDQPQEAGSGPLAGIVSAVGVALLGAASSYFAYQKKKLCFKVQGGADPEMGKGQRGTQSDGTQIFSNLLRTS